MHSQVFIFVGRQMREKGNFNPYFEVFNSPNLKNLINHTTRYQIVSYKSYFKVRATNRHCKVFLVRRKTQLKLFQLTLQGIWQPITPHSPRTPRQLL